MPSVEAAPSRTVTGGGGDNARKGGGGGGLGLGLGAAEMGEADSVGDACADSADGDDGEGARSPARLPLLLLLLLLENGGGVATDSAPLTTRSSRSVISPCSEAARGTARRLSTRRSVPRPAGPCAIAAATPCSGLGAKLA